MLLLQLGDVGPSVASLQVLLNRHGAELKVDGRFGSKTRQAVTDYQSKQRVVADSPDGTVGTRTWGALTAGSGVKVIDAVDISQPEDILQEAAADLRCAGSRALLTGGMCNGVGDVLQAIVREAASRQAIVLLRMFGHGIRGSIALSLGKGEDEKGRQINFPAAPRGSITIRNVDSLAPLLAPLRPYFAKFGSAELHSCNVASGLVGRSFVNKLAGLWGVPVSAGVGWQTAGGTATFRFEGPVYTAYPGGGTLQSWGRQFMSMSI